MQQEKEERDCSAFKERAHTKIAELSPEDDVILLISREIGGEENRREVEVEVFSFASIVMIPVMMQEARERLAELTGLVQVLHERRN